jgi:glycerophosphoryl diester phosphodiesterase
VFLQTFSFEELKEIRTNIFPEVGVAINLIQLVENNGSYSWVFEEGGMAKIAKFADGIGPDKSLVISPKSTASNLQLTPLVSRAHEAGLKVHPYTYRLDPGQLPDYADNFEELLRRHFQDADVDGVFTDFPDRAIKFLERN